MTGSISRDPLELFVLDSLAAIVPGWGEMDEAAREAARLALPEEAENAIHDALVERIAAEIGLDPAALDSPPPLRAASDFWDLDESAPPALWEECDAAADDSSAADGSAADGSADDGRAERTETAEGGLWRRSQESEARELRRENLGPAGVNRLNALMLLVRGVGEDRFWFNEFLDDKGMGPFVTIADYDRKNHDFQERCIADESKDYVVKPWRGRLFGDWARFMLDGRMVYAGLCTLASYLHDAADEAGAERIKVLTPSRFVKGPRHGKRENGCVEVDLVTMADGAEDIEDALSAMRYRLLCETLNADLDRFHAAAMGKVWIVDKTNVRDDDPWVQVVFSDTAAMGRVRLRNFVKDARFIEGDAESLEDMARAAAAAHVAKLDALHAALRSGDWSVVDDKIADRAKEAFRRAREAEARSAKEISGLF